MQVERHFVRVCRVELRERVERLPELPKELEQGEFGVRQAVLGRRLTVRRLHCAPLIAGTAQVSDATSRRCR